MSNTVDQKIVKMLFDNAQFEQGINQSIKSIDNLKQSLKFDNIGGASIDSLASNLSGLGSSVDNISSKFTTMGIMSTTWIAQIASALGNLAGDAVQKLTQDMSAGYNRYNEMMESIQTIMYATRNQWDDTEAQMDYVTAQIDKLNWYTDETSYNLSDMTNSIGKFVAAGVSLDDAATAMEGISSWAAISGQNAEKASYAMYNLAQAMAIGKVTAADWKSIENANMATEEFKETAINTAVNLGYLNQYVDENGNWFTYYAKKTTKGIKEIQVTTENMRSTLSEGWFTSEVLTETLRQYGEFADQLYYAVESTGVSTTEFLGYLDEYQEAVANGADMDAFVKNLASREHIDNVAALGEYLELLSGDFYELGRASFKAAQESKTFKDTMDYTADAITTTWMNIFQDIFGNYLESKKLWTDMSELMYEQMVRPIEELEEQLASWNSMGGADYLKDAFWNFYETFNNILKAIKEGWETIFPNTLARELLYAVKDLYDFSQKIRFVDWPWYSDFENLKSAAESIARVFNRLLINLSIIGNAIGDAWNRIFPKTVNPAADSLTDKIRDIAAWLENLSKKFLLTEEEGKKLERTFAGLFALLDIGRLLLIAIIEPFTKINAEIDDVNYGFLDATASLGDWLVSVRDFIRDNDTFKKAIEWLVTTFQKIPDYLDRMSKKFLGIGLDELLEKIGNTASTVFMAIIGLFTDFDETVKKIDLSLEKSPFFFIWTIIRDKITNLRAIIIDFFNFLSGKKEDLTTSTTGMLSSIWNNIVEFFNSAKKGIPGIKEFFASKWSGVTDIFDNIKEKASGIWTNITEFASTTWGKIKGFFDNVRLKISDIWTILVASVGIGWGKIKEFFTNVKERLSVLWNDAGEGASGLVSKITKFFTDLKSDPSGAWKGIKDKAKETFDFLGDLFSKVGKKIAAKFEGTPIGNFFEKVGDKAKTFWTNFTEKLSSGWSKVKDFFGLVGTGASDIWSSIPGWIDTAKGHISTFFEEIKLKFEEIWAKVEPHVTKISDAFKALGDKVKTAWGDNIGPAISKFFSFISEKGSAAIDWLMKVDWAGWWEEIKLWVEKTWASIKQFFKDLPENARQTFKDLTGLDWETFLDKLAKGWEWFTKKVEEAWDATKKFFEDLPDNMDKLAQYFGYDSFGDFWDNLVDGVTKAYHALKIFFGLEEPEWYLDKESGKLVEGKTGIEWTLGYAKGILTYEDVINKLNEIWPAILQFFRNLSNPENDFVKSIKTILYIAAALGALYLIWKGITAVKSLVEEGRKFLYATNPLYEAINELGEIGEAAQTFLKSAGYTALAMVFLEIAGAVWIMAQVPSERIAVGVGAMLLLFGVIFKTFQALSDSMISSTNMMKIAVAFGAMATVFDLLAVALFIVQDMNPAKMLAQAHILSALFMELLGTFEIIGHTKVDVNSMELFSIAMVAMGVAMIEVAFALKLLDGMDIANMANAALQLGLLFGALTGAFIALHYTDVDPTEAGTMAIAIAIVAASMILLATSLRILQGLNFDEMFVAVTGLGLLLGAIFGILWLGSKFIDISEKLLIFAGAIAIIAAGALMAGAGVWLIADAIEKLSNIGPEGIENIFYGMKRFSEEAPGFAESAANSIGIFFTTLATNMTENRETWGQGLVDFFGMIIDAIEEVGPRAIEVIGNLIKQFFEKVQEVWPAIEAFLLMVGETALALARQAAVRLMELIVELTPLLMEHLRLLLEGIFMLLETFGPRLLDFTFNLTINTLQHILDNIGEITALATAIAIEIVLGFIDGLSQEFPHIIDTGIEAMLSFINGIADGIEKHAEDLRHTIENVKESMVNAFYEFLGLDREAGAGELGKIAGQALWDFIQGIRNMQNDVWEAIKGVCAGMVEAAQGADALDENSPSKKFEEIGEYAGEGLQIGISNTTKKVTDAARDVGKSAVDGLTSIANDVKNKVNEIISNWEPPTITPVMDLSEIMAGAEEIKNMTPDMSASFDLASINSFDLNARQDRMNSFVDNMTKAATSPFTRNGDSTSIQNTFNITGDDPKEIANEISTILQTQVDRRNAVWA